MGLQVADPGAHFQDGARYAWVDQPDNASVKSGVDLLQQRFAPPEAQILLDLSLMLIEFLQAKNFRRRAANQTIRSNNHPCFQREILVSP